MTKILLNSLLLVSLSCLLSSCVGTVEEADTVDTQIFEKPTIRFNYQGIINSRAVSEDKVEIEFFPAGATGYEYQLTINDSIKPVTLDPNTLLPIFGGKFLYTVKNLNINTEYKLKLTAKNISLNSASQNENVIFIKTFDNRVADFDGIGQLTLVPGNASSEVKVDWLTKMMDGVIEASNQDAIRYEITYISEIGGIVNINNPSYSGTDRIRITQPDESGCLDDSIATPCIAADPFQTYSSVILKNLQPNTRYFVQVRAINKLYETKLKDNLTNNTPIDVSRELNTRYSTIKTAPATNEFDFDTEAIILANAPGQLSLNTINVYWASGQGNFDHYRVFIKKYVGSDPLGDDQLDDSTLLALNSSPGSYYIPNDSKDTFLQKDALEHLSWYQVKVALCKTADCNLDPSLPNPGIVSVFKAIQIKPILAPFSGISQILPPGQYTQRDVLDFKFSAPILSAGHADRMEFYCVNPLNNSQQVLLSSTPIASAAIPSCQGLYLPNSAPSNLANFTSFKVKGVQGDGTKEYCFAATPAITGITPEYRQAPADRIIRCIHPEIIPPTVAQFPGIKQACQVENNSAKVSWNLPTGGVYSGFVVFWKEKSTLDKFSFPEAVSGSPLYSKNIVPLGADITEFTISNLIPGKSYQVGVLADVDMDPSQDLFSEYNLNIKDCIIPLPAATFKGFTRILALGPKMDGRVHNDSFKKIPTSARLFEAVNADGIPFEVPMLDLNSPDTSSAHFVPAPGDNSGESFNSYADTAPGANSSNMSRNGIVSLAWEEAELSYTDAQNIFQGGQDQHSDRANRKWGYRIYRSMDNKLTWQNITPKTTSGLIHARNFSYYPRPNAPVVTKRMAFLTDYSVQAMEEVFDASKNIEIERARNYFYKIVPVFNNQELTHVSPDHHIVKITLPPPNMALVHRWMANRGRCLEMGKTPNIGNNYSCSYNGLGAVAASIPESTGNTILDQKGDLLVDRQELGCRFTRGDMAADPVAGRSAYERDLFNPNILGEFRGFPHLGPGGGENSGQKFMGCVGATNPTFSGNYEDSVVLDQRDILQGDCIGNNYQRMALTSCSSLDFTAGRFRSYALNTPGLRFENVAPNCSEKLTPSEDFPNNIEAAFTYENRKKYVMQSEPLAVFHNRNVSSAYALPFHGPTIGTNQAVEQKNRSWLNDGTSSNCSINLAAIDGSGYMHPRWLSITELSTRRIKFKNDYPNLLEKTVEEISEVSRNNTSGSDLTFYNGDAEVPTDSAAWFKKPTRFYETTRYRPTTKMGRVISSNAAKLPPLGEVPPEAAVTLCQSYNVQVGIATDAENFHPETPVVKKRLLRRTESIAASAWPENFNHSVIVSLERPTAPAVIAGACNNTTKAIFPQNSTVKGNKYNNNFPLVATNTTVLSGSAPFDITADNTQTNHTAACVSKFGIQDIVGNVKESNSERIFCDYSKDRIFLGPVDSSSWGSNIVNSGMSEEDSVSFFNSTTEDDWFIVESGTLNGGAAVNFTAYNHDGSVLTNFKPWVKISTESGYCSVVDNNPNRREDGSNVFSNGSQWTSIFNPGGSLNLGLITKPQLDDQKSVSAVRNGDGRFLDFGPNGLLSALNYNNSLSLNGVGSAVRNKFFNPVIGLPLACNETSCDDENLATGGESLSQNDNVSFTTLALSPNLDVDQQSKIKISDFYIGQSIITNPGVSQFTYTPPTNINLETGERFLSGYALTEVHINASGEMQPPTQVHSFPDDFQGTLRYSRVGWDVPRSTEFRMTSGGGFREPGSGRYSMDLNSTKTDGNWIYTADEATGTRCGVLINED